MRNKKKTQYYVSLSLTNGKLDPDKIAKITKLLPQKELRDYYKALLRRREEEKVMIATSVDIPSALSAEFRKLFVQKDVVFVKDQSLIAGLKVKLSDFLFDASARGYLEKVLKAYGEINR